MLVRGEQGLTDEIEVIVESEPEFREFTFRTEIDSPWSEPLSSFDRRL